MNWFRKLFPSRASQQPASPPKTSAPVASVPSGACDYNEMKYQVVQECVRIFNECLEGKHLLHRYKDSDSFRVGDTKVSFFHWPYSRYYGVYYGHRLGEELHIKDSNLEVLAFRVYEAAKELMLKKQRDEDCKKMEELLRS